MIASSGSSVGAGGSPLSVYVGYKKKRSRKREKRATEGNPSGVSEYKWKNLPFLNPTDGCWSRGVVEWTSTSEWMASRRHLGEAAPGGGRKRGTDAVPCQYLRRRDTLRRLEVPRRYLVGISSVSPAHKPCPDSASRNSSTSGTVRGRLRLLWTPSAPPAWPGLHDAVCPDRCFVLIILEPWSSGKGLGQSLALFSLL